MNETALPPYEIYMKETPLPLHGNYVKCIWFSGEIVFLETGVSSWPCCEPPPFEHSHPRFFSLHFFRFFQWANQSTPGPQIHLIWSVLSKVFKRTV